MASRGCSRNVMAIDASDVAAGTAGVCAVHAAGAVVEAIGNEGLAVVREAIPDALVGALRVAAHERDAAGEFRVAGVGRAAARVERTGVRGDRIRWLEPAEARPAEAVLFALVDALRVAVNEALLLGLFDFEGHYAIYPAGAGYARHLDRFRDDDARVLTLILYLNGGWSAADGGQLRVVRGDGTTCDVVPEGGTLVAFLSDRFPHEVLPASRERLAFTGWFRRRG
jgi:SM-20-related protein